MRICIGASGYSYRHWNDGVFYPRGVKDRLACALARMTAIEISSSFYRMPPPEAVAPWAGAMPEGSRMVLGSPQPATHRRGAEPARRRPRHLFFNNTIHRHAPHDAMRMMALLAYMPCA